MTTKYITLLIYHCFFSYLISGLSTTGIMRLTVNQNKTILTSDSYCENCGYIIPLLNQFPIFSYLFNKGRCKNCGASIPVIQFILECTVFVSQLIIGFIFEFEKKSFVFCFIFYELLKVVIVIIRGRRKHDFILQLIFSFFYDLVIFGMGYTFCYVISLFI